MIGLTNIITSRVMLSSIFRRRFRLQRVSNSVRVILVHIRILDGCIRVLQTVMADLLREILLSVNFIMELLATSPENVLRE